MPLTFTNDEDEPLNPTYTVEDASDEEENFEVDIAGLEEGELNEERSVMSASDYELDAGELPDRLLFGDLECRAIFTQKSDNGKFHRVCGCRAAQCGREGHAALRMSLQGRAPEGTYEPVRARKYVDGRFDTHLPKEAYFATMEALQNERRAGVREAAAILKDSPTVSEDLEYRKARTLKGENYSLGTKMTPKKSPPPSVLRGTGFKYPSTPVAGSPFTDQKPMARTPKAKPPAADPNPEVLSAMDQQAMMTKMMESFGIEMMKKFRAEFPSEGVPSTTTATKAAPKEAPKVIVKETANPTNFPIKHWYAVINGKGGVNSVFPEWIGGAAPYVTGVAGALTKKFNDFNEAWDHVVSHVATTKRLQEEDAKTERIRTAAMVNLYTPVPVDIVPPASLPSYPRPPLSLIGPDPSTKKEDELFDFEYGSEVEVRTKMCPPGLGSDHAKSLANAVVDVVALPGGFTGGNEEKEGSDMAMMSAALAELVQQGRSSTENATKSDLHWRSDKRIGLRYIKDLNTLIKRLKDLLKLRDRVLKNMIRATVNVLKRAGWTDMDAINAWGVGGYFTKLVRDTMDAWIALHQHLLGLATTENVPWAYVQVEIDHHVEELELLRNTQDSRLQALCANYTYVRDGHAGSWHSTSLQYKRNAEIFTKVADADYCKPFSEHAGGSVKSFPGCTHCGTILHTGGKIQCPWKKFSKKKAKTKANASLLALADGSSDEDESAPS
jgi:hypothetical protein